MHEGHVPSEDRKSNNDTKITFPVRRYAHQVVRVCQVQAAVGEETVTDLYDASITRNNIQASLIQRSRVAMISTHTHVQVASPLLVFVYLEVNRLGFSHRSIKV